MNDLFVLEEAKKPIELQTGARIPKDDGSNFSRTRSASLSLQTCLSGSIAFKNNGYSELKIIQYQLRDLWSYAPFQYQVH